MFTNTLSKNAQNALALLGSSGKLPPNTYLAGGSGLALHLGHRVSVDFDFFTTSSFNQENLANKLSNLGRFTVTQVAPDTLLGVFNGVKFSLFRLNYPLIKPPTICLNASVASPEDIGAMKLSAVMTRGTKKDFIDLYFLDQAGVSLDKCLECYDQKYEVLAGNIYSLVISLSYFVAAEELKMPKMLKKVSWREVKKFFEKESVRLAKAHL